MAGKTPGQRLKEEIERWGNIRRFANEMRKIEPRPRGASRAMIHRYLDDETVPPLEFYQAAASILGVPVDWLRDGIGSRSGIEAPAAEDQLWTDLFEGVPELQQLDELDRYIVGGALLRLAKNEMRAAAQVDVDLDPIQLCRFYWRWMRIPIWAWSRRTGARRLDPEDVGEYILAALPALSRVTEMVIPRGITREEFEELHDLNLEQEEADDGETEE